jgi:class 3 adenylate cyclase
MDLVVRAWDELLRREVALQFLFLRENLAEMTLREVRTIARLNHENIVRVLDVDSWSGGPGEPSMPLIVMEYLEGKSLASVLRWEKTLGPKHALEIMRGVITGLAHLHGYDLVHGDLKPGNILLTRSGTVKLLGFGLSQLSTRNAPLPPTAATLAYMAPELWRGERQDARTDVWAAGIVFYKMLTGRLPYPDANLQVLRALMLSAEPVPPVSTYSPEVPREAASFLATALAKDPARRFSSALEYEEGLWKLKAPWFIAPWRQRQPVTLVSCLLKGLNGLLDTESKGQLEMAFHSTCVEVIEEYGGSVSLAMAGEVLACFGLTQWREDDAVRAVRAALRLALDLAEAFQRRVPHLSVSGVAVKVGIHTGIAVLDEWMLWRGGDAIPKEASKVAARLARQADAGEVLLSDTTWRLVSKDVELEEFGPRPFEGWLSVFPVSLLPDPSGHEG